MYKRDLSRDYSGWIHAPWSLLRRRSVRAVGWLSSDHEFPRGEVSEARLNALKGLCLRRPARTTRGHHRCAYCGEFPATLLLEGRTLRRGSYETDVYSADGRVEYRAPNLIIHYIERHDYRPPEEFLEALDSMSIASVAGTRPVADP
jgi:hypothetical protein